MSGIVGSYFNTRGSGIVAKLGTDGQVFTSSGAGVSQDFEAAAGGGKVLQVIPGTLTSEFSTVSTTFVETGLTCAITPSSTSSKILILVTGAMADTQTDGFNYVATIYRDATNLGDADYGFAYLRVDNDAMAACVAVNYLDEPSSVSEIDYKLCIKGGGGAGETAYFARNDATAIMTVMEIGA